MAAAALFGKRSTRFRHVYGLPAQKENCYDNIRVSANAHDSMFCAVNRHYLAVVLECAGGGGFSVLPINRTGRIDHNAPKVCGHSAPVMDVKWNPFNDNIVASASDDATVKLWEIPRTGIRSDITRWTMDLRAHSRRVAYIEWHPTAENILLSGGFDHTSVLWNCEIGSPVLVSHCHSDVILSLSWNRDGSLYATTCKDRTARVIDPRTGKPMLAFEPHQGSKTTKIAFLGDTKQLFTTGFSQFAQRQFGLWDMRNTRGAIKVDNVDSASGALFPFYDHDTRMIYLAGKGDGNIRYYELTSTDPYVHFLSEYQSPHPQRGLGVMPKLGLDSSKCEIFRFYKLHSNRPYCEPISMIAPRKAETFQEDLYPPTAADRPALSAIEWIGGTNRDPILVNIREPSLAVNSPPMVTSRPVQLTRMPSQTLPSPQGHGNKLLTPNGNGHPPNGIEAGEIDENSLPQSVRNIRKLVGDQSSSIPSSAPGEHVHKHENGGNHNNNNNNHGMAHGNGNGHGVGMNELAFMPVSSVPNTIANSHFTNGDSHPHVHRANGAGGSSSDEGKRIAPAPSEMSLASRGSDSVFEQSSRRSEAERPPSPVAATLSSGAEGYAGKVVKQLPFNNAETLFSSRRSLTERPDGSMQEYPRIEYVKPILQLEQRMESATTSPKQLGSFAANDGGAPMHVDYANNNNLAVHHHHHANGAGSSTNSINVISTLNHNLSYRHEDQMPAQHQNGGQQQPSTLGHGQGDATSTNSPAGAFRPVVSQRHPPQPPQNLAIPPPATLQLEKPVSSGFVVQTAISSAVSPPIRSPQQQQAPSQQPSASSQPLQAPQQQENSVPTAQKVIQKMPFLTMDTQQAGTGAAPTTDYNGGEFPLASPQYRRGATGGNAYHPQPHHNSRDQLQQPSSGLVRSPSGRGTRPDILDALQEQLSASSRVAAGSNMVLNAPMAPSMHQAVVYSNKGPAPQAAHLQIGPVSGGSRSNNNNNSRNLSPAERRYRNRTIGADGQHILLSPGEYNLQPASPGYAATARVQPSMHQQPLHQSSPSHYAPTNQRRPAPPVPNRVGVSPRGHQLAVDDMAPAIMRHNQQSPSGLARSQTTYFPVDSRGQSNGVGGSKMIMMPISSAAKNGGGYSTNPVAFVHQPIGNGNGHPDKGRSLPRPKRDTSAAPTGSRQPIDQSYHRPQQQYNQAGEEPVEAMSEADLRSCCRRQRDEIRLLKRQADAKDQVIARLEGELRHIAQQVQQRFGGGQQVNAGNGGQTVVVGP